mmetsp:Transcript_51793/g.78637  ORF Transcript_51793/g.78637 Transcript_51793/m.78637 type:complete len:506 (+) Transcript_51793:115-1632(+)
MAETESLTTQIERTEAQIQKVESQIEAVEKRLLVEDLSREDLTYWREEKKQLREKEIIFLRRQDAAQEDQRRPPLFPSDGGTELNRKVDLLLEATRVRDRATPQYSPALIGMREKERLSFENRFLAFEERVGEESILSVKESADLSLMKNEHQLVAFITPHLEKVFCDLDFECCVYNSEEQTWIEAGAETTVYNLKPDLIVCHPAIITEKRAFSSQDEVLKNLRQKHSYKYGVLSKWKLRDAIGLTCEANMSINNQAFGEVINYASHLCFGKHGSIATRLILFDKTQCWLVESVKGSVSNVTTFNWLDQGSVALLRGFVRQNKMIRVLEEACTHFSLTLENDSFLGAGAFGHVFRATRSLDKKTVALKIVLESSESKEQTARLEIERYTMKHAYELCPEFVMKIEEDGFTTLQSGAALILSDVGEHYSSINPQKIVDSLKRLHNQGILHGDARLENVVCVNGEPVWIDFADSIVSAAIPTPIKKEMELEGLKKCVEENFCGYKAS